jgi:ABC-type nickel/cobalt efflux system permease component RcnA
MVTFTHTVSVFALGLVTLYLSRFVLPETITPILGAISGLTIVWVGATLLYRRTIGRRTAHTSYPRRLAHDHGDGRVHSHVPEEIAVGG